VERGAKPGLSDGAAVSRWEGDRSPGVDEIAARVDALDVDGDWLLTGTGKMDRRERGAEAVRLSIIGKIAGGTLDDAAVRELAERLAPAPGPQVEPVEPTAPAEPEDHLDRTRESEGAPEGRPTTEDQTRSRGRKRA